MQLHHLAQKLEDGLVRRIRIIWSRSEDLAKAQDYIEAHSSDAQTLRKVFDHMKRFPPVARRGIAQGDIQSPSNVAAGTFAGEGKGH
jgi:hypothetical protein